MLNSSIDDLLAEKHICPHCNTKMSCCHAPPFHVGDGLGWGSEYMFICLNDDCPLFVKGWKYIEENFSHTSSYRYMIIPGEKSGNTMMVGSKDAFKGSIVDPEAIKAQNKRYAQEKQAVKDLEKCVAEKNLGPALHLILDEVAGKEGRHQACKKLIELNDTACIDPIRNHTFKDPALEHDANLAISQILAANYKIECPFCAEIIKAQAKVCRFCNRELE